MLIPSCTPLKTPTLSPPSTDDALPPRYTLTNTVLSKPSIFTRHLSWTPTFSSSNKPHFLRWRSLKYCLTFLISLLPLLINGTLSHFRAGTTSSPNYETWKSYTMQWLASGVVSGLAFVLDQESKEANPRQRSLLGPMGRVVVYILSASPAIGGFIVVGQMVREYGVCSWVG
ncbi:uncharacterized protein BDR25DRAFT_299921 [Lindgomyces ingoldianus]|uniref:Uncharacterized protein n=1 Tax=Lindgomyces ingoldianus TaxID=673940 RepID=A0ACB6RG79_9PLEO|nr:uncharacterized protein BDR25DRAFT_299921 [Lindgomyces ingoldianus]KAF2478288.1 hypothetical protein BDR25DRAFT_299921 [Lindgomyces ingoldianus]